MLFDLVASGVVQFLTTFAAGDAGAEALAVAGAVAATFVVEFLCATPAPISTTTSAPPMMRLRSFVRAAR